jgi:AcrR family transcriptional regulator
MPGQRARSLADKATRRAAILHAAGAVFDDVGEAAFTMDEVAARVGLARGTLYRYFPTREVLLVWVLREDLAAWFDDVTLRLPRHRRAGVSRLLVDTLLQRPRLVALLALAQSSFERNLPVADARDYKTWLVGRAADVGASLDRALDAPPGSGADLLVHLNAALIGLYHAANPAPAVAEAMHDPALSALHIDLRAALSLHVAALIGAVAVNPVT